MSDNSEVGRAAVVIITPPQLITVDEVAGIFRCCRKTIYRRVANGTLPAIEIGGRFLFDAAVIRADLIASMVRPKSSPSRNVFASKDTGRSSNYAIPETHDKT
jgi:excisionase family DNA binding protein